MGSKHEMQRELQFDIKVGVPYTPLIPINTTTTTTTTTTTQSDHQQPQLQQQQQHVNDDEYDDLSFGFVNNSTTTTFLGPKHHAVSGITYNMAPSTSTITTTSTMAELDH